VSAWLIRNATKLNKIIALLMKDGKEALDWYYDAYDEYLDDFGLRA
jgi:hypothetical protein